MIKELNILCPDCNGGVGLEVDIQNMFGKIKSTLSPTKIEITFAGLLARSVKISGKRFVCMSCGKSLDEDTVLLRCQYSGINDLVSKFTILRSTNTTNGVKSKPIILHESKVDDYVKDAEKSGHEVYKRTAKLSLQTEVGDEQ